MALIHRRTEGACSICGGNSCVGFPDRPTTNSPFIKGTFEKMAQEPQDDRCVEEDTTTGRDNENKRARRGPKADRARRPAEDREKNDGEDR